MLVLLENILFSLFWRYISHFPAIFSRRIFFDFLGKKMGGNLYFAEIARYVECPEIVVFVFLKRTASAFLVLTRKGLGEVRIA